MIPSPLLQNLFPVMVLTKMHDIDFLLQDSNLFLPLKSYPFTQSSRIPDLSHGTENPLDSLYQEDFHVHRRPKSRSQRGVDKKPKEVMISEAFAR